MRKITVDDCVWKIDYLGEDYFPTENDFDPETLAWVTKEIENGNLFAWFCCRVTGIFQGTLVETAYLGGCSYESEADFLATEKDGYLADMKKEVVANLNESVEKIFKALN